jgi:hypothetical protein
MGIVSYQGLIYIVGGCTHSRRHMQVRLPITGTASSIFSRCQNDQSLTDPSLERFVLGFARYWEHDMFLKHCTRVHFLYMDTEHSKQMGEWTQSPCEKMAQGCCDTRMIDSSAEQSDQDQMDYWDRSVRDRS